MRKPLAVLIALVAVAFLACSEAASATATSSPAAPPRYVEALFLLNHPDGLNRFVRSVSEPGSPNYRRYATVEQLVKRFGATAKHRRATLSWLEAARATGKGRAYRHLRAGPSAARCRVTALSARRARRFRQ